MTTIDTVVCMDALAFLRGLEAESVDLIFTDPPYDRASIPLYGILAQGAAHCLKPGGGVLAMAGNHFALDIMQQMAHWLEYTFTFHVDLQGGRTGGIWVNNMHITPRVKPIYAFGKGRFGPRCAVVTPFAGNGNDKRFHHWGQDMQSARYFIDCFSSPGDLVVDPFCGGGTTAVVCKALDRHFIVADHDSAAIEVTTGRLNSPFYMPKLPTGQMALNLAGGDS